MAPAVVSPVLVPSVAGVGSPVAPVSAPVVAVPRMPEIAVAPGGAPPPLVPPAATPPRVHATTPAAVTAADDAEWDSLLDALDEKPGPV